MINEFTKKNGRSCMMFAYGQTGTGKTHTIFGPNRNLKVGVDWSDDWGIFPRVVSNTLKMMKQNAAGGDVE